MASIESTTASESPVAPIPGGTADEVEAEKASPTHAPAEATVEGATRELQQALGVARRESSHDERAAGVARLVEAVAQLTASLVSMVSGLLSDLRTARHAAPKGGSSGPALGEKSGASSPPTGLAPRATRLSAIKDDAGAITVRTPDGYMLKAEGREEAWRLTGPDGHTTRVWGDPHVRESDGDRWDFNERGTFLFGGNKVTVEVNPAKDGKTITRRLTVYSGDQRVTIGGIDSNTPFIQALAGDGREHDDQLQDGISFWRELRARGESWSRSEDGKRRTMGR